MSPNNHDFAPPSHAPHAADGAAELIVLDVRNAGPAISPLLFSFNLEYTRRTMWAGLSAELLANRKFAGESVAEGRNQTTVVRGKSSPQGVVARWQPIGVATFNADRQEVYCGSQSQRIEITETQARGGIGQSQIALQAGREYAARFQVKANTALTLTVRLRDASGHIEYVRRSLALDAGIWREWAFQFHAPRTDIASNLEITFEQPGIVWIGAASLLPADHFLATRRDVIARLKEMSVPLLRWPGGNFTRDYHWKEGLLPVDKRPPVQSTWSEVLPFTENYDSHDVGIDEYIALCRDLGAEPCITLRLDEDGGAQEAADWVEYCNGSPETRWGIIRAQRGHKEPYRVRYWSIGNEIYGYWMSAKPYTAARYAEVVRRYSAAMRNVDPSLVLIAAGLDSNWDKTLVSEAGASFDWLARHEYVPITQAVSGPKGAAEFTRQAHRPEDFIRPWLAEARAGLDALGPAGKRIGISFDEWNIWHDWFPRPLENPWHIGPIDAAFAAAQLNMLCRETANLHIPMAAMFQPINEGAISVTPLSAKLTAMGQVFALFRSQHGGHLLAAGLPGNDRAIDACASLSPDGTRACATLVNCDATREQIADIALLGATPTSAVSTILSVKELQPDGQMEQRSENLAIHKENHVRIIVPRFGIALVTIVLDDGKNQP